MTIIKKNCLVGRNWYAWLPEKQWYYCGLRICLVNYLLYTRLPDHNTSSHLYWPLSTLPIY